MPLPMMNRQRLAPLERPAIMEEIGHSLATIERRLNITLRHCRHVSLLLLFISELIRLGLGARFGPPMI